MVDADLLWSTIEGADSVRSQGRPPTRGISTEELRRMLAACRQDTNTVGGARDGAALATLATTGARRAEVAGIELPRLDLDARSVDLHVKGGHWRTAALHPAAIDYLALWLSHHPGGPHLFCPVQKNGVALPHLPIGDKAVWKLVAKRRDQAGLDPRITPHSFRRWFVTTLLDAGVDILTVSRAAGHASPATTQIYDRRGEESLRRAIRLLDLPTVDDLEADP
jgi:integrase/recombinase XerD